MVAGTVILPLQVSKAQNMIIKMGNSSGNVTLTGNEVSSVISNLAAPGYGNKYDVAVAGKTIPINYNIIQGTLVGILADP